jgi:hypothetical protein
MASRSHSPNVTRMGPAGGPDSSAPMRTVPRGQSAGQIDAGGVAVGEDVAVAVGVAVAVAEAVAVAVAAFAVAAASVGAGATVSAGSGVSRAVGSGSEGSLGGLWWRFYSLTGGWFGGFSRGFRSYIWSFRRVLLQRRNLRLPGHGVARSCGRSYGCILGCMLRENRKGRDTGDESKGQACGQQQRSKSEHACRATAACQPSSEDEWLAPHRGLTNPATHRSLSQGWCRHAP